MKSLLQGAFVAVFVVATAAVSCQQVCGMELEIKVKIKNKKKSCWAGKTKTGAVNGGEYVCGVCSVVNVGWCNGRRENERSDQDQTVV